MLKASSLVRVRIYLLHAVGEIMRLLFLNLALVRVYQHSGFASHHTNASCLTSEGIQQQLLLAPLIKHTLHLEVHLEVHLEENEPTVAP